jgi:inner membrane transporter RhtA
MISPKAWTKAYPTAAPLVILMLAMLSTAVGAAIAKTLVSVLGAAGATTQRLTLGMLMAMLVSQPWRARTGRLRSLIVYGVAMGCMNLCFYAALRRIPLGIAVALEFSGPLAVAMLGSRRRVDFLWVALALLGIVQLLPLQRGGADLDLAGIGYALGAGACWALYIVAGRRAGLQHGAHTVALGLLVAALVIAPAGILQAGTALWSPALLPRALAVALLSSALPYSLEMVALTRLPTKTFGVLMSLEPALAAVCAFTFLGEHLSGGQWAAVVCVMAACGGSAATSRTSLDP